MEKELRGESKMELEPKGNAYILQTGINPAWETIGVRCILTQNKHEVFVIVDFN